MSAPVESTVRVPDDSGNTGPYVRTQYRSIAGKNQHMHYAIRESRRAILGIYDTQLGSAVTPNGASAHTPSTSAYLYGQLPSASTRHARIRFAEVSWSMSAEADMLSVPRIAMARFTFTGTSSGSAITPSKRNTADSANDLTWTTAVTGMTLTLGALIRGWLYPTLGLTTSGMFWAAGPIQRYDPQDEDEFVDLAPGEGIVFYQADAGTASDTRRFTVNVRHDEYDNS